MSDAIQGLGTDIVEIYRIQEAIDQHGDQFLDRLFTPKEKQYCLNFKNAAPHFAGRFAAKEAILKAFGTGLKPGISWKQIQIINNALGKPEVELDEELKQKLQIKQVFLSISHCNTYATATALIIGHSLSE